MNIRLQHICRLALAALLRSFGLAAVLAAAILPWHEARAEGHGGAPVSFAALSDVSDLVTIEEICCDAGGIMFPATEVQQIRSQYGESAIWLKISGAQGGTYLQLSPVLDHATLFAQRPDGNWWMARTGDLVPQAERMFPSPFMILPIPEDLSGDTVFVRIVQPTALTIRGKVWDGAALTEMQDNDKILKTFLLGGVSAIIVYNIFVAFLTRRLAFLFNALCITSLLVFTLYLSGYGVAHFWDRWAEYSNAVQITSLYTAVAFGAAYMWSFLFADHVQHRAGSPIFVAPGLASIVMLLSPVAPYWIIQACLILAVILLMSIAGWITVRRALRGDPNARILLFPFVFAMTPGIVFLILTKIFGVQFTYLGNNSFEVTLCFEAILFSLALASRIRSAEVATRNAHELVLGMRNERAARVIAAQDQERKRLATELHDGIGQDFLVVLGNLKRLAKLDRSADWKTMVDDTISTATNTLENLRGMSREMHPSTIEFLGLEKTIRSTAEHISEASEIEISVDIEIDRNGISTEQQLHIFRIVQECLSNVVRHSGANRCRIVCRQVASSLHMTIEDDGVGLQVEVSEGEAGAGLGLASIGERVFAMDGSWETAASELGGAKMTFILPMTGTAAGGRP